MGYGLTDPVCDPALPRQKYAGASHTLSSRVRMLFFVNIFSGGRFFRLSPAVVVLRPVFPSVLGICLVFIPKK